MMKKKQFILAFSVIFAISLAVSCGGGKQVKKDSSAGKKKPTATGWAKIYDGDTALAKDRAINVAQSNLVKNVLGNTVSGAQTVKNFRLVESIVTTKSRGMVKDMDILEDRQQGDNWWIKIAGFVEEAAVDEAIKDALDTYGKPKFIVLIRETFEGVPRQPGYTQSDTLIQQIMGNSGFEFMDAQRTQTLMATDRASMENLMAGNFTLQAQMLLLNNVGAEVVIVGTAVTMAQAEGNPMLGNMKSRLAQINVKAIDMYTGKILAAANEQKPGVHIQPDGASRAAILNTLQKLLGKKNNETGKFESGEFMNNIVDKFVEAANNRQINVLVAGLEFMDLMKFKNQVEQRVRGVNKIENKGNEGGISKLEVYFAGKTDEFAYELNQKAPNMGFNVKVTKVYPNKIDMLVTKK